MSAAATGAPAPVATYRPTRLAHQACPHPARHAPCGARSDGEVRCTDETWRHVLGRTTSRHRTLVRADEDVPRPDALPVQRVTGLSCCNVTCEVSRAAPRPLRPPPSRGMTCARRRRAAVGRPNALSG